MAASSNTLSRKPPLILVDGSSYLFRAFHALPALQTSKGQPTGAVRGVISMIRKLVKDYPAANIGVVFDAKGKTFRHHLYEQYKANRPEMAPELRVQIQPIHDIIRAMGLPLLIEEGVEADDVIGTLARLATEQQLDVVISTGDKDMAQLVNQHISLVNTMDNSTLNVEGVLAKFGVPTHCIIDYLALVGDTSDNIPGVPKVGPKTAVKWLQQYGSMAGVVAHADEIGGKVGENLRASLGQLPLSYELATIKCDVSLPYGPADLVHQPADTAELLRMFKELEFKGWVAELLGDGAKEGMAKKGETPGATLSDAEPDAEAKSVQGAASHPEPRYEMVLQWSALERWIDRIKQAGIFALDTETTSLNYMEARLVGLSLAITPHEAAYIPVGHDYVGAPAQLPMAQVLAALKPVLEDSRYKKIGQNLKYDMNVLANHGIRLQGVAEDSMLQSYVLNSTYRHDLDSLALQHLNHTTIHFEDIAGKGAKQLTFNAIEIDKATQYAAEDADITLQLFHCLGGTLKQTPSLMKVYREIEVPLVPVLSHIECQGTLVDTELLRRQSHELAKKLAQLEQEAHEIAGRKFNLDSPKQLQAIFFDQLQLPILRKTPKGQPSTAEPVLQELALDYPLPRIILEYRGCAKLKSTYTDKLPQQVCARTGRIHTSYQQAVAATGRLSSTNPNLQNIPIRTEEGRRIRQAFIAPQGYRLVAADYSQIELRIMAHLSQDQGLKDAFAKELDVHRATAAEVFGVPFEQVTDDQRRRSKAINFGLIYGMSAFGLGRQLNIGRNEAQSYIDRYFQRYPGVLQYMDGIRHQARESGYVETLFGRRLYLPDIRSGNAVQRQAAERTAINAPMQGTAADIIKQAMIEVDAWLAASKLDAHVIMQVHDELVLEVAEAEVEKVAAELRRIMSEAVRLDVPLVVDVGVGLNWDEAH